MNIRKSVLICVVVLIDAISNAEVNDEDDGFGASLVQELRNDVNLDLPVDEEYEDLRAELLAYHTTLAKLTEFASSRRSLIHKDCWRLGGICIDFNMCSGHRYLAEVRGCRDKKKVCCFSWNHFAVKDLTHLGIRGVAYPWDTAGQRIREGKGSKREESKEEEIKKLSKKKKRQKLKLNVDLGIGENEEESGDNTDNDDGEVEKNDENNEQNILKETKVDHPEHENEEDKKEIEVDNDTVKVIENHSDDDVKDEANNDQPVEGQSNLRTKKHSARTIQKNNKGKIRSMKGKSHRKNKLTRRTNMLRDLLEQRGVEKLQYSLDSS